MKKNKQPHWVPLHNFTGSQFQMRQDEKYGVIGSIGVIILLIVSLS